MTGYQCTPLKDREKMAKTEVAIEEVIELWEGRQRINRLDIEDIIWTKEGKPLSIRKGLAREFEMTGLNNNDFILTGYYWREKVTKENFPLPPQLDKNAG